MKTKLILSAIVLGTASLSIPVSAIADTFNPITGVANATGGLITGVGHATTAVVGGVANGTAHVVRGVGEGTSQVVHGVVKGTGHVLHKTSDVLTGKHNHTNHHVKHSTNTK